MRCDHCGTIWFAKVYDTFSIRRARNHQTGRDGYALHYRVYYAEDGPPGVFVAPRRSSVFLLTREGAEEMREMLAASDGRFLDRDMLAIFTSDKARDARAREQGCAR